MFAVMVLLEEVVHWRTVVRVLSESDFMPRVKKIKPVDIGPEMLSTLQYYTKSPDFDQVKAADYSLAARYLCMWVLELESMYNHLISNVAKKNGPLTKYKKPPT